jgi:hypothetical protein
VLSYTYIAHLVYIGLIKNSVCAHLIAVTQEDLTTWITEIDHDIFQKCGRKLSYHFHRAQSICSALLNLQCVSFIHVGIFMHGMYFAVFQRYLNEVLLWGISRNKY